MVKPVRKLLEGARCCPQALIPLWIEYQRELAMQRALKQELEESMAIPEDNMEDLMTLVRRLK